MKQFSSAFFGALQIFELVAPSRVQEGGLLGGDVSLQGTSVECLVQRSKADQFCRGVRVFLHELSVFFMCPVRVLCSYLKLRTGLGVG